MSRLSARGSLRVYLIFISAILLAALFISSASTRVSAGAKRPLADSSEAGAAKVHADSSKHGLSDSSATIRARDSAVPGRAPDTGFIRSVRMSPPTTPETLVAIARTGLDMRQTTTLPSPTEYSFSGSLQGNRSALFTYSTPVFSSVRIEICNAIGQTIELIMSGLRDTGVHEFAWEAPSASKCVYFCRFKAIDAVKGDVKFTKTVRMIF